MSDDRNEDSVEEALSLLTGSHAEALAPLHRAELYGRLTASGWTEAQIAKRVGRSQPHVHKTLSFLQLGDRLRALVEAGALSATLAVSLQRDHGDNAAGIVRQAQAMAQGKRRVTARDIAAALSASPKSLSDEEQLAINARLLPLLWHLDHATPTPGRPGFLTITLLREEVEALQALRGMLALKPAGGEQGREE